MAALRRALKKYGPAAVLAICIGSATSWYLSSVSPSMREVFVALLVLYGVAMTVAYLSAKKKSRDTGQAADEQRDDVYRLASHDLRAAVRQIRIALELLLQNPEDERIEKAFDWLRGGTDRIVAILDTLKEWTEIHRAPSNGVIDLNEPLQGALGALSASIDASGAEIRVGELPKVKANKNLIASVFQNVIDNSIKYRHKEQRLVVDIAAEVRGDFVVVSIKDNGRGFEDLEGAFRMFRRLHADVTDGTGSGLPIVRAAIQRHGGTVVAESQPGKGTTIRFTLPRA